MKTPMITSHAELFDKVDKDRAKKLQTAYGRVKWIISWYKQDTALWKARASCQDWPDTVEAVEQSRCLAIDSATRKLMDLMHQQGKTAE